MKAIPFALFILLGVAAILSGFSRGSRVPVPPPLVRRPVVYNHNGPGLRLDGLAIRDAWDDAYYNRPSPALVQPLLDRMGRALGVGKIQGTKLTQGSRLLLRLGHPFSRYTESFPRAPVGGGRWQVEPGVYLEVRGRDRVEVIELQGAPY